MQAATDIIAIVDDDKGIRVALDGLLRSGGFRVVTFPSAEAFLSSTSLASVACLILDLHMPGLDGLGLQRRLADDGRRIPIIILTAHGGDDVRARALSKGAAAFLTKPVDGGLLLSEVARALRHIT